MSEKIENIKHVFELARLEIDQAQIGKYVQELGEILNYVADLQSAPTDNAGTIKQIAGLENVMRADEIEPSLNINDVLKNAPQKEGNFIKVKRVL